MKYATKVEGLNVYQAIGKGLEATHCSTILAENGDEALEIAQEHFRSEYPNLNIDHLSITKSCVVVR